MFFLSPAHYFNKQSVYKKLSLDSPYIKLLRVANTPDLSAGIQIVHITTLFNKQSVYLKLTTFRKHAVKCDGIFCVGMCKHTQSHASSNFIIRVTACMRWENIIKHFQVFSDSLDFWVPFSQVKGTKNYRWIHHT